jgi:hypothetical protein
VCVLLYVYGSVADPRVLGPPGSGSGSTIVRGMDTDPDPALDPDPDPSIIMQK